MAYFPAAGSSNDSRIGHAEFDLPAIAAGVPYTLTHGLNSKSVNLRFRKNIGGNLITPGAQGEVQYITWRLDYTDFANKVVITPDTAVGDSEIHVEVEAWYGTNDIVAPTAPTVTAGTIGFTTIEATASGATDTWGVKGYNWFLNGNYVWTTYSPTYTFTGLTANTSYAVTCSAIDAAGNTSALSSAINPTTLAFADVAFASAGALGLTTSTTQNLSTNWQHIVGAGNNRYMVVGLVISTMDTWLDSGQTQGVSSTVGGVAQPAFTYVGRAVVGSFDGSEYKGWVALFVLDDPAVGTHTITATASYNQNLRQIRANSYVYHNCGGYNGFVTTPSTASAMSRVVTSTAGDMAVCLSGWDVNPSSPNQTVRNQTGAAEGGTANWYLYQDAPGAATVTFTAGAGRHCEVALNLTKAVS